MTTSALFGFLRTFLSLLKKFEPDYLCFAFDKGRNTFRNKMYSEYKAHRQETPEELREQFPYAVKVAQALGAKTLSMEEFEADDILGSVAHQFTEENKDLEAYLVTGDRDSFQLVRDRVFVGYTSSKAKDGIEIWDIPKIEEKYGLPPEKLIQVKALQGDTSDNIPGVKGVGEKTALKLVKEYETLPNLYENIDQIKGKLKEKLETDHENALISEKLAAINTEIELPFELKELVWDHSFDEDLRELLLELEFHSLVKELFPDSQDSDAKPVEEKSTEFHCVTSIQDWKTLVKELQSANTIAFDTETTSLNSYEASIVGISFSTKAYEAWYVPLKHSYLGVKKQLKLEEIHDDLCSLLEDKSKTFVAHNFKYDLAILRNLNLPSPANFQDTLVLAQLLHPQQRRGLKQLASSLLGVTRDTFEEVAKDTPFSSISLEQASEYAGADAENTLRIYEIFKKEIAQEQGLTDLLNRIELPLIPVLENMERTGVQISPQHFEKLSKELHSKSEELRKEILEIAGEEFNLNSTKQLSKILYEKLEIPALKKTKTGYSTATDVLEKLADEYPICSLITNYRHLTKLLSTYVKPLPDQTDSDQVIHTNFNQTIAATGRLSSTNPNLQNIPVRSEWGARIRAGFIPRNSNSRFVSIDYSQIELRVLAHFAGEGEGGLLEAFRNDRDIHHETAAKMKAMRGEGSEVSKQERESAKAINFGIIYGISAFGLSQQLNIPVPSAKEFIETYFEIFPRIKSFMDETTAKAIEDGFVTTHYGRKRWIPELQSKNRNNVEAGKRIAINTKIQGTAAEIMKIAMISLHEDIHKAGLKSRLILQVHDELIFEVVKEEMDQISNWKEKMEAIEGFRVPIKCDVEIGDSWGSLEAIRQ